MVRDAGDAVVAPFEPYMLLSASTSVGSLVSSIKYIAVPNPKGVNPRGHQFLDNVQSLADTVTAWLGEQRLQGSARSRKRHGSRNSGEGVPTAKPIGNHGRPEHVVGGPCGRIRANRM
jgi:hypothetical protein